MSNSWRNSTANWNAWREAKKSKTAKLKTWEFEQCRRKRSSAQVFSWKWLSRWFERINFPCNMMNCLQVYKPKMKRFAETALQTGINPSNAVAHLLNHTLNIHLMKSEFHFISYYYFFTQQSFHNRIARIYHHRCVICLEHSLIYFIFFLLSIINLPAHLTFGWKNVKFIIIHFDV